MVMYSSGSSLPGDWFWKKLRTSSNARRASSCEGGPADTGEEMVLALGEDVLVVAGGGGGAILEGLLFTLLPLLFGECTGVP